MMKISNALTDISVILDNHTLTKMAIIGMKHELNKYCNEGRFNPKMQEYVNIL